MIADPVRTAADLAKLNKVLFAHEHIQIEDAAACIKKPRTGAAEFVFKRPRYSADSDNSASKKQRVSPPEAGT